MTNNRKILLTAAICSAVVAVVLLVIILNYKRMKQSIQGTVFGKSYFTIDELCQSATASKYHIDNTPTATARASLQTLIDTVLDPARRTLGSYIKVNNGYRSQALNNKLRELGYKPSTTSQHLQGEAADITAGSISKNKELFAILVAQGNYDQLIWEHSNKGQWIHVSHKPNATQRHELLSYNGSTYTNIATNWQTALA